MRHFHFAGSKSKSTSKKEAIMNIHEIQDRKADAVGMFVQPTALADADVSASPLQELTLHSRKRKPHYTLESIANQFCEAAEASQFPLIPADAANLMRFLRQLEALAIRQAPRIAFKAKGKIVFLDLPEIVAVQAEGNYISLQHSRNPYLLRESLSSIAEKLKPYGFIRIHRSVVVNAALVEEIEPLSSGECRVRVKGGAKFMVTRRYKDNLRQLAHLWIGGRASFCLTVAPDVA
jgi:DNA-binding LytR/AlgR family response regulator